MLHSLDYSVRSYSDTHEHLTIPTSAPRPVIWLSRPTKAEPASGTRGAFTKLPFVSVCNSVISSLCCFFSQVETQKVK